MDFTISYYKKENKIYVFTKNEIDGKIFIYDNSTSDLIYWNNFKFNNTIWIIPDFNLNNTEHIKILIKNMEDDIIYEKIINVNDKMKYFAETESDRYIRENYFQDYSYKGTMIELGAGPPEFYSMSKHFRDNGWRCICIEPNPKFVEQHRKLGNEIYQYACSDHDSKDENFQIANTGKWPADIEGVSTSSIKLKDFLFSKEIENIKVEIKKIDTLLTELHVEHIDFISVDTEGWELEVMMGFNLNKYDPKVVLLENTQHDEKYTEYMNNFGYELDIKIEHNYIYKKKENLKYYGQDGEDREIERYFPDGYIGGCIDVGSTDGVHINNTKYFEERGWYCMCFEPNPSYFYQCENNRKNALMYAISDFNGDDVDFNVVNLDGTGIEEAITSLRISDILINDHIKRGFNPKIKVIKSKVRTLDFCIENYYKYDKIDFVSIDTEGTELDVLKGFDINKYQPKLFIIENNDRIVGKGKDGSIEDYLLKFDYVKDKMVGVNDFYVKKIIENNEMDTFGNIIDKLTIVNLKIWKYEDIKRDSKDDKVIADATRKTNILNEQRNDLIQEIDEMLIDASNGKINFKNYKQGDTKKYGK